MTARVRRCPICDSKHLSPFQDIEAGSLRICAECRHIAWDRMPDVAELSAYYRSVYTGTHNQEKLQDSARAYYRSHLQELLNRTRCPASKATLVDFGCSFPTLLEEARSLGFARPIGVEPDAGARDRGASLGIEMHAPEAFGGAVPNGSVHIARFSHVLEHLPDPLDALRSVVRKMARGGLIHVTQPSFPVLAPDRCEAPLRDCVWPEHLHFFNALSLRVLAERAGLARGHAVHASERRRRGAALRAGNGPRGRGGADARPARHRRRRLRAERELPGVRGREQRALRDGGRVTEGLA